MNISKRHATAISLTTATLLAFTKVAVGLYTGSLMVISSAMDSFLDMASSLVNFYAVRKADLPPDDEHPYGHGKFEPLATLFQSLFILISGIFIVYRAVMMIINGEQLKNIEAGIGVMIFSTVATFLIVVMLRKVAVREKSSILKAEALHYETDLLSGVGIVAAIVIIHFTKLNLIDSVISILIAGYIIKSAVGLMLSVANELLDKEIDGEDKEKLLEILSGFDKYVFDFHQIRTRKAGGRIFIDMHVTMFSGVSLYEAHAFADIVEAKIKREFDNADILVHTEPCDSSKCGVCDKKCSAMLKKIVEEFNKKKGVSR